jgi:Domain of unknown function (DUF3413)
VAITRANGSQPRTPEAPAVPGGPLLADRRSLLRWLGWFTAANTGCAALVGVRYLWAYAWPSDAIGIGYAFCAFVGHSAFLAFLFVFLPASLPAIVPARRATVVLAVVAAATMLTLLFLDANVFAQFRYHLDPLTAALFEPVTWLAVGSQFVILLVFESLLARLVSRGLGRRPGVRPASGWPQAWWRAGWRLTASTSGRMPRPMFRSHSSPPICHCTTRCTASGGWPSWA